MGESVYRVCAHEMRKISHPVFPHIEKYWLTVAAKDFPSGISTAANARDPIGLNRRVYKDVRASLDGESSELGTFDLMNKGITILALNVKLVDKSKGIIDITIDNVNGGIVDGAHTAEIIKEANRDKTTPDEQYVEVYIRTGVTQQQIADIARGLNTGIQVAPQSIYNIGGVFDWLKKEVKSQPYANMIAWSESDEREYDVRDLIGILEVFNIFDFPNDVSVSKHPIAAYEKWSTPLKKFADDFETNEKKIANSKYHRLRPLLIGGLMLYDRIRHDFHDFHNEAGGRAGRMNILEEASERRGLFDFPFAQLPDSKYRLTKGATLPILGAFRNFVYETPSGDAAWVGGIAAVLRAWEEAGPDLVAETYQLTQDGVRNPDQLGKNRKHWATLYMRMQLRLLQAKLHEKNIKVATRRRVAK